MPPDLDRLGDELASAAGRTLAGASPLRRRGAVRFVLSGSLRQNRSNTGS